MATRRTQSSDQRSTSGAIHYEYERPSGLPANVTYNDLIRSNKIKSTLLMICMVLLLIVLGGVFGGALAAWGGSAETAALVPAMILGMVIAAVLGALGATWSFFSGANAILSMSGAIEIEHKDDPQLFNVVEELAIAAGIPKPKVYVIEDPSLNAFATGRDPEHGVVAITAGLRATLNRDELAGVMAHEIGHIRNYDIRFAMLMATMVGLIVFAADAFRRMLWYGMWMGGGRRSSRGGGGGKGGNPLAIILLVAAILLAVIAPALGLVIRFAVSRQREFLADASAVEITRYPQGLISALEKLGGCKQALKGANRATAHMYIVNPMKNAMRGQGHELNSMFRTHPPLHDRVDRLRALIH